MKKFYCPTCKCLKSRRDVSREEYHVYFHHYVCKWCHQTVITTEDAIEEVLHRYSSYNEVLKEKK